MIRSHRKTQLIFDSYITEYRSLRPEIENHMRNQFIVINLTLIVIGLIAKFGFDSKTESIAAPVLFGIIGPLCLTVFGCIFLFQGFAVLRAGRHILEIEGNVERLLGIKTLTWHKKIQKEHENRLEFKIPLLVYSLLLSLLLLFQNYWFFFTHKYWLVFINNITCDILHIVLWYAGSGSSLLGIIVMIFTYAKLLDKLDKK